MAFQTSYDPSFFNADVPSLGTSTHSLVVSQQPVLMTHKHWATERQQHYLDRIAEALASTVLWHGLVLSPSEWIDLLVAAWRQEFVVPGLLGGHAWVGGDGRPLSASTFSELLYTAEEFIAAIGLSLTAPTSQVIMVEQLGNTLAELKVIKPVSDPSMTQPQGIHEEKKGWGCVSWTGNHRTIDELNH